MNQKQELVSIKSITRNFLPYSVRRKWIETQEVYRFCLPNFLQPKVKVSSEFALLCERLRKNGIVSVFNEQTLAVAHHLERQYFEKLQGVSTHPDGIFAVDTNESRGKELGVTLRFDVSFKDSGLGYLFTDPDITGMIYNYYRRQPYFRNQPMIQTIEYHAGLDANKGNEYHVDHLQQVSGMLLVSDQAETDTHMDYVLGSHRRSFIKDGIYLDRSKCDQIAGKGVVYPCVGPKGTLFIFDTSGVHRRNLLPGRARRILHFNVTTGHHFQRFKENLKGWTALSSMPEHTRRMFDLQLVSE